MIRDFYKVNWSHLIFDNYWNENYIFFHSIIRNIQGYLALFGVVNWMTVLKYLIQVLSIKNSLFFRFYFKEFFNIFLLIGLEKFCILISFCTLINFYITIL